MEKSNLQIRLIKLVKNKYFIASVLFLAWLFFFDEDNVISHQKNKQRLRELAQQKEYYHERIESDKRKLEDLKAGIEELEKFARENYYMSKPGEDVYIVVEKN